MSNCVLRRRLVSVLGMLAFLFPVESQAIQVSIDLTELAEFTPLSDQYRDIGVLFGARLGGEPVLQDSGSVTAIPRFGNFLFYSPDVYSAVAILRFVQPGTNEPAIVTSFTGLADGDFQSGEMLEIVVFDSEGNQVATHTDSGALGPLAPVGIGSSVGFSSLEIRTFGNPGIAVGDLVFDRSDALAGDYNANGVVDAADYTVWRNTLGQAGTGLAADGTGPSGMTDGIVNQLDYDLWKTHFGESAGSGSGIGSDAAVPEPATLGLLVAAIVALALRRSS